MKDTTVIQVQLEPYETDYYDWRCKNGRADTKDRREAFSAGHYAHALAAGARGSPSDAAAEPQLVAGQLIGWAHIGALGPDWSRLNPVRTDYYSVPLYASPAAPPGFAPETVCYKPCRDHEGMPWTGTVGVGAAIKFVCPHCDAARAGAAK